MRKDQRSKKAAAEAATTRRERERGREERTETVKRG